jgi:hypothetical protein
MKTPAVGDKPIFRRLLDAGYRESLLTLPLPPRDRLPPNNQVPLLIWALLAKEIKKLKMKAEKNLLMEDGVDY